MHITPASGALISPARQQALVQAGRWPRPPNKAASPWESVAELSSLPPAQGGETTRADLEPWIRTELGALLDPAAKLYFGDQHYYLPTGADLDQIWKDSKVSEMLYTDERFDCDDYAFVMKGQASRYAYLRSDWSFNGICVGFASGSILGSGPGHAANLAVCYEQGRPGIMLLEPANGTRRPLRRADGQNDPAVLAGLKALFV